MKIEQSFTVAQPLAKVWAFFQDVPKVAACLPGATYTGLKEDGSYGGKVTAKVGPFQASFEGEARVQYEDADKRVLFEGKGVDRKGASRGKMTMQCQLAPSEEATLVSIDADVQLAGAIAQFGRTGLLTEIASRMIAEFVSRTEAELGGKGPDEGAEAAAPLEAGGMLVESIKAWGRGLVKKT
jgi:carbon-monoxide dehydrogenase small subunit